MNKVSEKFAADSVEQAVFMMLGADGFSAAFAEVAPACKEHWQAVRAARMHRQARVEMTDAIKTYAPLMTRLCDRLQERDPIGVFGVEVAQPFGRWLWHTLLRDEPLRKDESLAYLSELAETFFVQGVERDDQDAVREIVRGIIDQADTDPYQFTCGGMECRLVRAQYYTQIAPNAWGHVYGWEARGAAGKLEVTGCRDEPDGTKTVLYPTRRSLIEYLEDLDSQIQLPTSST